MTTVLALLAAVVLLGCFDTAGAASDDRNGNHAAAVRHAAQRPPGPWQGCPYEAVCIYPRGKGWNGGHPQQVIRASGSIWAEPGTWRIVNLHNMYGVHKVFVNDYNFTICPWWHSGLLWFMPGYDGHGIPINGPYAGGESVDFDLTPVNSIKYFHGGWQLAGC